MGGGPPCFRQGFSCLVVLWILPLPSVFGYGALTRSGWLSQNHSPNFRLRLCSPQPRGASPTVWAHSRSLAATKEVDVSFFSSGYLDVSVPRVPPHTLWIGVWVAGFCPAGFPHSEICGSMDICSSPQLIAAYHVFLRLLVPRHPPCALISLTCHAYPRMPWPPSVAALQVCSILDVWPTIPVP